MCKMNTQFVPKWLYLLYCLIPHYLSCFIGKSGLFYGTFLVPILTTLLFTAAIFVTVIIVVIKNAGKEHGKTEDRQTYNRHIRLAIGIMGLTILFGLTWLFGALTITEGSKAFQALFVVLNIIQGFFIFLFFCIIAKDPRELWLEATVCVKRFRGSSVSKTYTVTPASKGQSGDAGTAIENQEEVLEWPHGSESGKIGASSGDEGVEFELQSRQPDNLAAAVPVHQTSQPHDVEVVVLHFGDDWDKDGEVEGKVNPNSDFN